MNMSQSITGAVRIWRWFGNGMVVGDKTEREVPEQVRNHRHNRETDSSWVSGSILNSAITSIN